MSDRTLLAGHVINLTEKEIYVYGSSGELMYLPPRKLNTIRNGELPLPQKDTYYIAEGMEQSLLSRDTEYKKVLVEAKYNGKGRDGRDIYKLKHFDTEVKPISDNLGRPGELYFHYTKGDVNPHKSS